MPVGTRFTKHSAAQPIRGHKMQVHKLLQLLRDNARNDGSSKALRNDGATIYIDDVIDA